MPKLPVLTARKVIRVLKKKGFVLDRVEGSHHLLYHPETKRRVTVPVHGRNLPTGTLLEILKQVGVEREEIEDLLQMVCDSGLANALRTRVNMLEMEKPPGNSF
ncbi:type II toxin-antitoxin system HicA family toxin [Methanoculleus sp. 7T]|uniref:type II toxin-antitoxin system HicA family toxin n=1 Tax=Methanoculleus sp. 7T TaxID=2937282 RepID=UPI0020C182AD|nr:type II toxin-antitoxin system HicA family toxin [Methanoculleus sp. 7T]MCK8517551.1 type II toxin-antitoxin system HicA family toxin [Methanoculleus sp. 7T]